MGVHEFAYALVPHAGDWREGGVLAHAVTFNAPLRRTLFEREGSFATVDGGLVLDTIKRAEDSDAIVLRLYEPYGGRGIARVRLAVRFSSARRTNLLEDVGDALEIADGEIVVPFRPREVITVMLT